DEEHLVRPRDVHDPAGHHRGRLVTAFEPRNGRVGDLDLRVVRGLADGLYQEAEQTRAGQRYHGGEAGRASLRHAPSTSPARRRSRFFMRDSARGPRRRSTATTTASRTAVAPTSESNGPTVSTLVTMTCRALAEAGESHGSVKRTTLTPCSLAMRAASIVSAW